MSIAPTYNPKLYEENIKELWSRQKIGNLANQLKIQAIDYKNINNTYTIVVPPPNLTGMLHAGHAFEHFLMDTLARIARQKKIPTLYQPGVDHAGIQLEGVISRMINDGEFDERILSENPEISTLEQSEKANYLKKQNPSLWTEIAMEKAEVWRSGQLEQAKIIGDSPDFERLLFTLDERAIRMVNFAFLKYWQDDLIYRDSYLINWSVALQTALSDVPEDIGHIEKVDPFVTFDYNLDKVELLEESTLDTELRGLLQQVFASITVATVRPETIFGDVAIAIHPQILRNKLLDNRINELTADYIIELIASDKIKIYFQIRCLMTRGVKLIIDEDVDPSFGSGCLKITPGHDIVDYNIAKKHGLTAKSIIARSGKLTEDCHKWAGQTVEVARTNVIKLLIDNDHIKQIHKASVASQTDDDYASPEPEYTEVNHVFDIEKYEQLDYAGRCKYLQDFYSDYKIDWNYKHNVTICERSKSVVEPLISEEFFVDYYKQFLHSPVSHKNIDFSAFGIENQRIRLEAIKLAHSLDLVNHMNEKDAELVISPQFDTEGEAKLWIEDRIVEAKNGSRVTIAIIDKKSGSFVGYTGIRKEDNQYKLTIWIANKYKNQGLAMESLGMLINWSFDNLRVTELFYEVKTHNTASIQLAQKLGFEQISQKNFVSVNGKEEEYYIYSLTKPTTSLQELAIAGLNKVNFYPSEYRERGIKYFEKIKNWCISRDLIWGHKMPIWYNINLNPSQRFYQYSQFNQEIEIDAKIYHISDLFRVQPNRPNEAGNWVQETKILDTWFSSTLWPLSTLGFVDFAFENHRLGLDNGNRLGNYYSESNYSNQAQVFLRHYPSTIMTSAWEIFYAWILRMVMTGMYFTGEVPFRDYLCHAWVLDEKGRKMSKSLNNGLDPITHIANFSVDSTRLAMLTGAAPGKNFRFQGKLADTLTEKYRNLGNKIWNVARFLEVSMGDIPIQPVAKFPATAPTPKMVPIRVDFDFKRVAMVKPQQLSLPNYVAGPKIIEITQGGQSLTVQKPKVILGNQLTSDAQKSVQKISPASQWILNKYKDLSQQLDNNFASYNLASSVDLIYRFLWDDYASWYLEYLKTDKTDIIFAAQLFREFIVLISPYIPFESQVLWVEFLKQSGLIAWQTVDTTWLLNASTLIKKTEASQFELVVEHINQVRSFKGLFGIDPHLAISIRSTSNLLNTYRPYLKLLAKIDLIKSAPKNGDLILEIGLDQYGLNILDYIKDKPSEILKTKKQIEIIQKVIDTINNQLKNAQFIERAEQEVIDQKRQDLADRFEDLKKQADKLRILS